MGAYHVAEHTSDGGLSSSGGGEPPVKNSSSKFQSPNSNPKERFIDIITDIVVFNNFAKCKIYPCYMYIYVCIYMYIRGSGSATLIFGCGARAARACLPYPKGKPLCTALRSRS